MVPSLLRPIGQRFTIQRTFFPHAALLGQGCPHCPIFPTAASRRSLDRVSVPMWPITLSGRLPIVGLVGRYLTNYLMGREPIHKRYFFDPSIMRQCGLMRYQQSFPTVVPLLWADCSRVTHPSATKSTRLPPEGFRQAASFDLHVLSTPPAFVLSQDQTL